MPVLASSRVNPLLQRSQFAGVTWQAGLPDLAMSLWADGGPVRVHRALNRREHRRSRCHTPSRILRGQARSHRSTALALRRCFTLRFRPGAAKPHRLLKSLSSLFVSLVPLTAIDSDDKNHDLLVNDLIDQPVPTAAKLYFVAGTVSPSFFHSFMRGHRSRGYRSSSCTLTRCGEGSRSCTVAMRSSSSSVIRTAGRVACPAQLHIAGPGA